MSVFKKIHKFIHPGARGMDKEGKSNPAGLEWLGQQQNANNELQAEMDAYGKIPENLRTNYLAAAKKAGTYGATSQFDSGLNSEVQAGARGARTAAAMRINALRKQLGNPEEFKPEDANTTSGNETADQLANAAPDTENDNPTSALGEAVQATSPDEQNNAAQAVQGPPAEGVGQYTNHPSPMAYQSDAEYQAALKKYMASLASAQA